MSDDLAGGALTLAVVYALASAISTSSLQGNDGAFLKSSKPLAERSAKAFAQLKDERQALNDQSRGDGKWSERVKDIAYNVRSGGMGWDWAPLTHYGTNGGMKLTEVADNANIAIIPARNSDKIVANPNAEAGMGSAMLIVDKDQGCLIVDFDETNEKNAAKAQELLREFDKKAKGSTSLYGFYTIHGTSNVVFDPMPKDQTAADLCGFTLPRETPKSASPAPAA